MNAIRRMLPYIAAAIALPLVVATVSIYSRVRAAHEHVEIAPVVNIDQVERPRHNPSLPNAIVVMGNHGTEITDSLPPYELLARSKAWNVYLAAPERRVSPFVNGMMIATGLAAIPHYSFKELEKAGIRADLIAVPYLPEFSGADRAVVSWLKNQSERGAAFLTICAGSRVLAETGILDGRRVTSTFRGLDQYQQERPAVLWQRDVRWVDDGNVISSSTLATGIDATLHAIERYAGRAAAERVIAETGYPYGKYLDDPRFTPPEMPLMMFLETAFAFRTEHIILRTDDGVGETSLAAVLDTLPLTMARRFTTLGPAGRVVRSANGLTLVTQVDQADGTMAETISPPNVPGVFPYDAVLTGIAKRSSRMAARAAAAGLVYPSERLPLNGPAVPWGLLAAAAVWSLAGIGAVAFIKRLRRRTAIRGVTAPARNIMAARRAS